MRRQRSLPHIHGAIRPCRHWLGIFLSLGLGLTACDEAPGELRRFEGATMGTRYSVQIARFPAKIDGDGLAADLNAILEGINGAMSTYDPESELSRFNRNPSTDWIPVSADTVAVMEQALAISRLSGGAFDVTVGPVVNLWGFGPGKDRGAVPESSRIAAALADVGYGHLQVRRSPPAVRKHRPELYVDLSAIAKGFAVDRLAEHLDGQGIEHYLVEVGGELRARGRNTTEQPWRVAIEHPAAAERTVHTIIGLENQAAATSGDYRNFFEVDGRRYSHTIDPRTGRPVSHRLGSVTVVAASAMVADGIATALMVLGPDEGHRLATEQELAALFLVKRDSGIVALPTGAFDRVTRHRRSED